jgi:hypothetical protein
MPNIFARIALLAYKDYLRSDDNLPSYLGGKLHQPQLGLSLEWPAGLVKNLSHGNTAAVR